MTQLTCAARAAQNEDALMQRTGSDGSLHTLRKLATGAASTRAIISRAVTRSQVLPGPPIKPSLFTHIHPSGSRNYTEITPANLTRGMTKRSFRAITRDSCVFFPPLFLLRRVFGYPTRHPDHISTNPASIKLLRRSILEHFSDPESIKSLRRVA